MIYNKNVIFLAKTYNKSVLILAIIYNKNVLFLAIIYNKNVPYVRYLEEIKSETIPSHYVHKHHGYYLIS